MRWSGWIPSSWKSGVKKAGKTIFHLPGLHPVLAVTGKTVRNFIQDDGHIMAAAIAFYAILSMIPFMLLSFSVIGYVLNHMGQTPTSQHELYAQLQSTIQAVVPFLSDDILQRLRSITLNRQAYGLTGLLILIITAGLVFRTLELAFARIFQARRHRSLLSYQLLFITFVLGIGLLFLLIHYLGVLGSSFYSAHDAAGTFQHILEQYALLRFLATIVLGAGIFVFLLKYFSRERIRNRASTLGGLLFAVLWLLAAKLFGLYLTHLARFSLLYGSLASLAIIVVWVFYSANILLLCAEFTRVLQERYWPLTLQPEADVEPAKPDGE